MSASEMLQEAYNCIADRAVERDIGSERSMASAVAAFNAMYDVQLTETMGWMFMVFLKASRAKQGAFKADDYIDGASYFALAGECHEGVVAGLQVSPSESVGHVPEGKLWDHKDQTYKEISKMRSDLHRQQFGEDLDRP